MKVIYHRLAVRDIRQILDYYESEAGPPLADRFFNDFLATVGKALSNPLHFPPLGEVMRRANLADFPYLFLYEVKSWGIRIVVVRHHRRNPGYGMRRQ
jgi:plasmid stabilization system protein ParE